MTFDVRKRAAVHEAAHAVATKAYGSLIHLAEICVDNPEWCGRVCHEVWGAWENVVVCLAGAQGELAFFNNEWGSGHDLECDVVLHHAVRVLRASCPGRWGRA